jgi:hypothetical protein
MIDTFRAYVSSWQRVRRIGATPEHVFFQVTLTCGHCSICSGRVASVTDALAKAKADWTWVAPPAGWPEGVRVVRIKRTDGLRPMEQLRRQLGLAMEAAD